MTELETMEQLFTAEVDKLKGILASEYSINKETKTITFTYQYDKAHVQTVIDNMQSTLDEYIATYLAMNTDVGYLKDFIVWLRKTIESLQYLHDQILED